MLDLSIVIVSWNVEKLLQECLSSIYKNQGEVTLEVFVVDNASSDNTIDMIKVNFPQVKIINNINNLGFSAANNQGIEQSQGKYILLLNPDTKIIDQALKRAVDFADKNHRIGVLGCKHLNPNLTIQPSVRRLPKLLPIILVFTKLAKILPGLPSLRRYLAKDFDYKITQPAPQVAGSFFLIRRALIEEIGVLDEKFFIWFEEVDYCKRTTQAGWKVWYKADAEIIHYGGQSFKQRFTLKKQLLFFKSAWYYFKKHGFIQ